MGRPKSNNSALDVAEKAKTPFAQALNALIDEHSNVKELTEYLGFSPQAINQYRIGQTRPSLESICKIADFYNVSVDYLLGRNPIPSIDYNVQKVHKYTGLTMAAIQYLHCKKISNEGTAISDILSLMLENERFDLILGAIGNIISIKMDSDNQVSSHMFSDAEIIAATINIAMARLIDDIEKAYINKFPLSPYKRKELWLASSRKKEFVERVPSSSEILARITAYAKKVTEDLQDGND